jgi:hypothetical protein
MRKYLLIAYAVGLALASAAQAAPQADCRASALHDLQRLSPQGHAIYLALRDKRQFFMWIMCQDIQLGLSTAVHESVHLLTEERDAYPLISGDSVRRQHDVSRFFAPREIAGRFDARNMFLQTYLRKGAASSADDFMYLLDELNAYSHDLNSAVKLAPLHKGGPQVAHRDGLAALMAFVATYVDTARQRHPATWQGLQRPDVRLLVQTLWTQAETVVAASCGMRGFGSRDRVHLQTICESKRGQALSELLGRPVACPSACLSSDTASAR